jgi:hypothetical protein
MIRSIHNFRLATGLTTELNKIKNWYDITSDGVFTNTGTMQTHGNLETSLSPLEKNYL